MRRWFTVIFALHLFLSVGLFAFAAPGGDAPDAALPEISASALHGAAEDNPPELPELMNLDVAASTTSPWPTAPVDPQVQPLVLPALDAPERPPRAFA